MKISNIPRLFFWWGLAALLLLMLALTGCSIKPAAATEAPAPTATEAPINDPLACPPPVDFELAPEGIVNILDQTTGQAVGKIVLDNGNLLIDIVDGQHQERKNANGGYEIVTIVVAQEDNAIILLIINKTVFACGGNLYHLPPTPSPSDGSENG